MSAYVSNCYIYPLKSGYRIETETLSLTERGPENDRRWMLVHAEGDKTGKFITQRDKGCEKLALIESRFTEGAGWLFYTPYENNLQPNSHLVHTSDERLYEGAVQIWKSECQAIDAGANAATWFSDYLGFPVKLVRLPDNYQRPVDPDFSKEGDHVTLADGFPLLITNTASLKSLQPHFAEGADITMDRFRANIVIEGLEPFEEDVIHKLRIGDAVLEFVKPCSRCVVTTVDQDAGIKSSNEPAQTLGKMRKGITPDLKGMFFGQNAIPREIGEISVGNKVEILEKRPMHLALEQAKLKFGS